MAYTDTILTSGTNGFYVDGTLYPLGSVALSVPSDNLTVAALVFANKQGALVNMKPIANYKDGGGTPYTRTTLLAFYSAHMAAAGGNTKYIGDQTITGDGTTVTFTLTVTDGYTAANVWIKSGALTGTAPYLNFTYTIQNISVSGTSLTFDIMKSNLSTRRITPIDNTDILALGILLTK
jgi:hypothetical protein